VTGQSKWKVILKHRLRTPFFSTCLGVFQGGGCRAAALAGAYQAAVEHGVHFAQVAGTSAGSIVAALVGAGASPTALLALLRNLDFRRFNRPPERNSSETYGTLQLLLLRLAQKVAPEDLKKIEIATLLRWGGLHSSAEIEVWLDDVLAHLLPDVRRPIRFRDLPVPTYVVATDLLAARPKVWSTFDTPDERVAFAVRASCSIPFYFQPVGQGELRYVDGGVLSNLPSFVFAGDDPSRPRAARVLAFQLLSDYSSATDWRPIETAKRIGSAIVDGAMELQAVFNPTCT
jgi:predicted acylesterase/phospholipase RssA